jgi:hypothetical protein
MRLLVLAAMAALACVACGDDAATTASGAGASGSTSSSSSSASSAGGAGGTGAAGGTGGGACSDPDTDLSGEYTASKTLERACSPYHLVTPVSFTGDGVVLTIEEGVQVLGAAGADLSMGGRAQLVAGKAGGEPVVFEGEPAAAGPWNGIHLEPFPGTTPLVHELHEVTIRGAAGIETPESGNAALYVEHPATTPVVGVLLDHVTIAQALDTGVRISREGSFIAPGSSGLTVDDAGGYPLVMDVQNFPGLPPNQDLGSVDPDKARILLFSGNDGIVSSEIVWPAQKVPVELGADIAIGSDTVPGKLTLPQAGTFLLRSTVDIRVDDGALVAEGTDTGCKDDGQCSIVFDEAAAGQPWGSVVFTATASAAGDSHLQHVKFANGGDNEPMVYVVASTGVGVIGDCALTTSIEGCWLESSNCFAATDSMNAYATDNGFSGCTADVKCD